MAGTNPLEPTLSLLIKLGSLIVHLQEAASITGHYFDQVSIDQLEADPELVEWLKQMKDKALLPLKRSERR